MTFIPDNILAELSSMSAPEAVCTIVLARATYGRKRKQAWLTYPDFQKRTMFKGTATIARALKAVIARGFFRRCPGQGSNWEIAAASPGEEPSPFFCEVDLADGEGQASPTEGQASPTEGHASPTEGHASLTEGHASLTEGHASPAEETAPPGAAHGPESGPGMGPNGPKNGPLPLYKEKSINGNGRERERKKKRAKGEGYRACPEPAEGLQVTGYKERGERVMPRPRTGAEMELAKHPAAKVWLEAGMGWPGWKRLRMITRRMGMNADKEALSRANELWLMAGYRPGNFGGILDWYESVCRDGSWRPFYRTAGQVGPMPAAQAGANPPDPTMAMLLQMQEELTHGKQRDDSTMFNSAQSILSQDEIRPGVGSGLPNGPG